MHSTLHKFYISVAFVNILTRHQSVKSVELHETAEIVQAVNRQGSGTLIAIEVLQELMYYYYYGPG